MSIRNRLAKLEARCPAPDQGEDGDVGAGRFLDELSRGGAYLAFGEFIDGIVPEPVRPAAVSAEAWQQLLDDLLPYTEAFRALADGQLGEPVIAGEEDNRDGE